MGTDREHRDQELFEAALDLDPEERRRYLDEHCADPELRAEVEGLLEHDGRVRTGFLHRARHDAPAGEELQAGVVVAGRYRLEEVLARGGMGVVWRALQERPRRHVALKVIRPGVTSEEMRRRFEVEAAVLGHLQHPGIAQIHEAGVFETGTGAIPFFAMELVEGERLDRFVAARATDLRERLEVFVRICDAVQHAHQKGVIHRDLKPGNILVTARGEPKVLDFGVARATDSDLQVTTLQTDAGLLVGTLPYMSPEQVEGDSRRIDTRADVYALGVLLYELLAGRLPHDIAQSSIATAARTIVEDEPIPLGSVVKSYRGDLSTITSKALEKDRGRRYPSAAELANDVRRFLADEPILARPASSAYQLRKFARRNRGLVAGASLAFVVLLAGAVVSTVLAVGQTRALEESERQRRIAEAVNDFLNTDLLGKANPYVGAAHDATLREVLDEAARTIDARLREDPLVHASVRATLGQTYVQLGEYAEAARLLAPAIEILRSELGTDHPDTNELRPQLALAHLFGWRRGEDLGGLESAQVVLDELGAAVEGPLAGDASLSGLHHQYLAILRKYQGRLDEAEQEYRRAIEVFEADEDVPPRRIAVASENLGILLLDRGRFADAQDALERALAVFEEVSGNDSADVAFGLTNLGQVHLQSGAEGGLERARACFERACEIRLERLGPLHPETLRSQYSLALALDEEGEAEGAERLHRDVLARRLETLEEDHEDVLWSMNDLAEALEHQGRLDEAAELNRTVVARGRERYDPLRSVVLVAHHDLLRVLRELGDQDGIRAEYAGYLAGLERAAARPDASHRVLLVAASQLVQCEVEALRDPRRALDLAERAVEARDGAEPHAHYVRALALAGSDRRAEAIDAVQRALELVGAKSERERGDYQALLDRLLAQRDGSG